MKDSQVCLCVYYELSVFIMNRERLTVFIMNQESEN
jgi:hypothetical protein